VISELLLTALALGTAFCGWQARRRHVGRWLLPYLLDHRRRRPPEQGQDCHLILCVADHFEPKGGRASTAVSQARVRRWIETYPRQFVPFHDSDGRTPRHTFFYPAEEYEPEYLDDLAALCRQGFGEVEVHLHHDADTADNLRRTLLAFIDTLSGRHGLLARERRTGMLRYGFIHGNWALDNARPDGRHCGVNNELDVLRETGCYADFTLPAAPSAAQTRTVNRIYYAVDDPHKPRSHDTGFEVGTVPPPENSLLLVQGPLVLDWGRGKWGLLPRLENACLQGSQPPAIRRADLWLRARVQVPTRPDWFFVKLHAHGAHEAHHEALLGEPMVQFHRDLAERAVRDPHFRYHYVTAREMVNLVKAAESGWQGSVADALDFDLLWQGGQSTASASRQHEQPEDMAARALPSAGR
jgi:hypothetical protein